MLLSAVLGLKVFVFCFYCVAYFSSLTQKCLYLAWFIISSSVCMLVCSFIFYISEVFFCLWQKRQKRYLLNGSLLGSFEKATPRNSLESVLSASITWPALPCPAIAWPTLYPFG